MHKYIPLIFSLTIIFSQTVENLTVGQLTDGSGLIEVKYDLIDDGTFPSYTVEVELSIDDSEFQTYAGADVSGDIGENVIPGPGKVL